MFRKGLVTAVHPEDHSVDLIMADDGSPMIGVQVLTPNGSTRSGTVDLPAIKATNPRDVSKATDQDMHAIVGFVGRHPVVTGFLYPQVNQMLHTDPQLRMDRHQSDVITTVDGDGNIQLAHPSGLYLRIGGTPEKVDYAGKNADASLTVDRNTSTTPYVRLSMPGGKAVLTIAPDGAVSLTTETTIDVTAQGNINVTTHANAHVTAESMATVTTPHLIIDAATTDFTGNVNIAGATAVHAITSNGHDISDDHRHKDVTPGLGLTGTPQ
jgi:hypothetical protein